MKKFLLLSTLLLIGFIPQSLIAQACPGANRTVTNSKSNLPNDAIGAVLKNFFQDGGSATWRFEPGATFVENTNGTATLKGVLAYYDNPNRRFEVNINFIGQTYTPPMGSPVQMNLSGSSAGWYYYQWGAGSTFTGLGDLAGAKLDVSLRGKAFQVGIGASDQVPDAGKFGATGWFSYAIVSQPTNASIRINSFPANPAFDQADIAILLSGSPTTCGDPCAGATDPVFTNCPTAPLSYTASSTGTATISYTLPSAGAATVTVSSGPASGASLTAGTYSVVFLATSSCNKVARCTLSIVVNPFVDPCVGSTNPVFTNCPTAPLSYTASSTGTATISYTLPSAGAATVTVESGPANGAALTAGTYSVVFLATNSCNKVARCTLSIVVNPFVDPCAGSTNPTFTNCPSTPLSYTATSTGTATISYTLPSAGTATVTVQSGPANGAALTAGTYSVIFLATNSCNKVARCTLSIVVNPFVDPCVGSTNPTFTNCPSVPLSYTATSTGTATISYTLPSAGTATVTVESGPANGAALAAGTYSVVFLATNSCNKVARCTLSIVINPFVDPCIGSTNPVFTNCPAGSLVYTATSAGCATISYTLPSAGTAVVTLEKGPASGSCLTPGSYLAIFLATNSCNKVARCTLNIAINAFIDPCNQVTDPGSISGNEEFCPGSVLTPVLSVSPATGGSGAIEYLWMYSTSSSTFDPATWIVLAGETGANLSSIPTLTGTTYFIRCVRRAGCLLYKETNVVIKKVKVVAEIVSGTYSPCLNQNVTFGAASNDAGATYFWSIPNGTIVTTAGQTVTVRFTSLGRKTVRVDVSRGGCTLTNTIIVDVVSCAQGSGSVDNFNASVMNTKSVSLDWVTTGEKLTSKYMVERSADGKDFELVAEISSQNNANNVYRFVDKEPKMGRSFYRLKHIENDGNISYTAAKKTVIYINGGEPVMAYPNPVNNQLFVEVLDVENTEGVIEIYNSNGTMLKSQNFNKDQVRYEMNLSGLPVGNYILRVLQADGTSRSIKVSKF